MSLEQELASLGETTCEVASKIQRAGIKGSKGSCISCPVARYLQSRGYLGAKVGAGSTTFYGDYVLNPSPVQQFVTAFDNGLYPELEA